MIKKPWPGMVQTLRRAMERYIDAYWIRFNRYYYTGDYARKDEDGYFWILGRADEVLKVAGHRIGTMELESNLVAHHAIAEAAVIGKKDPIKYEVPVAFVVPKENVGVNLKLREEIIKYVKTTVGPIATPSTVSFVKKLPKTRSRKIMRRLLKAIVTNQELGDVTTLEDESSIEEVGKAYMELKESLTKIS